MVMFFVVAGACGLFFFWSSWPWIGMIAAALVFFSVGAAGSAIQNAQLNTYGTSGVCQVLNVVKRTYQERVSDGNDGGHYETRVVYQHHLRCPPGGPSELSRSRILAYNGESLGVIWDRTGHVQPLAASERRSAWSSWRIFLTMYGLILLILLAEAFIDLARYPRRSSWDFGSGGSMTGSFMNMAEHR
jgi:hypothetical protein